ncbi:hypothetical protein [Streptomyces violaceus]|uniref:Uncharacterized protein n=1 Tax=Streptomyces violaceus TaxID=1936 RepID=A0ABY9UMK8_STRVL|nr:hypothetical protein [Streptomyces janthinus]WND24123.1 hypothetical protein RI060_43160 [Streptomyces janthinus]GGS97039.1 hypothetical protein GCM10010270_81340 [Streptomyces janthinus]
MSTESEHEATPTSSDPDPVDIEPQPEPEPEETEDPPPPPDSTLGTVVTVDPGTWYEVTSVCTTATCPNLNTSTTEPMVYSNAGSIRMVCGRCGFNRPILTVTKLDPQPEMS